MPSRNAYLNSPAFWLVLFAALLAAGDAKAHRLDAQAFLLPGHRLQVEGWYSSGEPAKGATVEIYRPNGQLMADGKLNEDGIFTCLLKEQEALRIIVSAKGGHRKEL